MCHCTDKIVGLFTRILNHDCCVWGQTGISFLVLWNFCYDFIDALLQLLDFGTDIYAIDQYSKKCDSFKNAAIDENQFNQTLVDFKNQSEIADTWTDNDVKEYIVYILRDSDESDLLSRRSQCGYYYASIPPMLMPSVLLLMFALCHPRWRKMLTWYKALFIIFSQITIPTWTIYLMVTSKYPLRGWANLFCNLISGKYAGEFYQMVYSLSLFLWIGESIPELVIKWDLKNKTPKPDSFNYFFTFQYLFYRRERRCFFKELVADSLCSLFRRTNTCGNDECFGCVVQLKEASQNRRVGGSRDATARKSFPWNTQTKLSLNQKQ